MKGRHTLKAVIVLALVCASGVVGMLITEGASDWLLLALAALPLAVGFWRWRVESEKGNGRV